VPFIAQTRAAVGLIQGFTLYLLAEAYLTKTGPATEGLLFAPLSTVAVYVPLILIAGLGNLRPRTLAMWTIAATGLCAALACYDIFRDPTLLEAAAVTPRIMPSLSLWLSLGAALFIIHSLLVAGETDKKFIASYPTYFDVAWKQGVQLILVVFFVAVLWVLLWLGAELFRLININFLRELIQHRWFWMPVTAMATGYAIHVTDVHAGLVRGARTLKLTLLSWLLPIMTLMAAAFVLALPSTGLQALWSTQRATTILWSRWRHWYS
jgi:hypothetical protein